MVGVNGSELQASSGPVGTTSVCPARHTTGRASPRRAQRLVTPLQRSVSQWKPSRSSRALTISWQPASSGVCDRRAISSRASSSVAFGPIVVAAGGGLGPSLVAVEEFRIDLEFGQAAAVRLAWVFADLGGVRARGGRILVHQPGEVGRRVGRGEGVFVGDHAVEVEPAERLLESLRSRIEALLHRLLDLRDLAVLDQFGNERGVEQNLHRGQLIAVLVAYQT